MLKNNTNTILRSTVIIFGAIVQILPKNYWKVTYMEYCTFIRVTVWVWARFDEDGCTCLNVGCTSYSDWIFLSIKYRLAYVPIKVSVIPLNHCAMYDTKYNNIRSWNIIQIPININFIKSQEFARRHLIGHILVWGITGLTHTQGPVG
jgi:hypothetical protein